MLHSNLKQERRDEIEAGLRSGLAPDVVVQVNILGEGYDLGTLSVAPLSSVRTAVCHLIFSSFGRSCDWRFPIYRIPRGIECT